MAFTLTERNLERVKEISIDTGRKALRNLGLTNPESLFFQDRMNGAAIVYGTVDLLKTYYRDAAEGKDVTSNIAEQKNRLVEYSTKENPVIPQEAIQLEEEVYNTYFNPLSPDREAGKKAWETDPRNNGLTYDEVKDGIRDIVAKAAATEVIKYLETLGWEKGPERTAPPR